MEESVRIYGKYLPLHTAVVFGGVDIDPQIKALHAGAEIIVATPGRLLDHLHQKTVNLSRAERCETCHGSGSKPGSQAKPCRRCRGQGVLLQRMGFLPIQQQVACPDCRGRGAVITDPCMECRGEVLIEAVVDQHGLLNLRELHLGARHT